MILARLEQADRYLALHQDFPAAVAFLRGQPLSDVPLGRIEIAGAMYAAASRSPARQRSEARLEAHRNYIDIQYVISGVEEMGWKARSRCERPHDQYDAEKDIEFFADSPDSYVALLPGEFVVFFPDDVHVPLIGTGTVFKAVKVPVADDGLHIGLHDDRVAVDRGLGRHELAVRRGNHARIGGLQASVSL
jgi:YhcH/YjgK/YiaL family protein